jgi:hypothetical protein
MSEAENGSLSAFYPALETSRLFARGWTSHNLDVTTESAFAADLIALANQFGAPVVSRSSRQLCDKLRPTDAKFAKPHSLSRKFSLGEFQSLRHRSLADTLSICNARLFVPWSSKSSDRSFGYKASSVKSGEEKPASARTISNHKW